MITMKSSIEPVVVFFFQRSVIICRGKVQLENSDLVNVDPYPGVAIIVLIFGSFKKGKRGQTGTFDQYYFCARFPMNRFQVTEGNIKLLRLFRILSVVRHCHAHDILPFSN